MNASSTPLQSLPFRTTTEHCDPRYAPDLRVSISEVRGSCRTLKPGERFVAFGRYWLKSEDIAWLALTGIGRSTGLRQALTLGEGSFELTAEILEVKEGQESTLDLVMLGPGETDLGVHTRILLLPPA